MNWIRMCYLHWRTMLIRPPACFKLRVKQLFCLAIVVFIMDLFGVFTHMFELDYSRLFHYPLEGDVLKWAHQVRYNQEVEREPINLYNFSFLKSCEDKCLDQGHPITPKIVLLIKSNLKNFDRRLAIRKTWGYENRFSDVSIRTVFLLGVTDNRELQKYIDIESDQYHDLVQSNFIDSYYNNTIKTMMGFKWATKYCPRSKFHMFVDDDFYISIKNVLRFLRNPTKYPEYLEAADETLRKLARRLNQSDLKNDTINEELYKEANKVLVSGLNSVDHRKHFHQIQEFALKGAENYKKNEKLKRKKRHLMDLELPENAKLFAGFMFSSSSPHRHKTSKWYVSLTEYPFHLWPPYITAGAFILSREALMEMYYVSMFTRHFRFDDIYLAILALKSKIALLHNEEFYFYKTTYTGPHSYRYVIASHGYNDPDELTRIWTETRATGHA